MPPASAEVFDDALSAGVGFQLRHGLAADGVLGRSTIPALAVPVASRVRQIELALERLRWLPDLGDERVVALNIPMFRLATWDGPGANAPALRMRASSAARSHPDAGVHRDHAIGGVPALPERAAIDPPE